MKIAFAVVAAFVLMPSAVLPAADKDDTNTELLKAIDSGVHEVNAAGDTQEGTNAKRDILERDAAKKLKDGLDGKQLTLTFPIKDVQGGSPNDTQILELGPPLNLEVDGFRDRYRDQYKTHLTKDQILKVTDDSVVTYSGKIAIQYGDYRNRDKSALITWKTSRDNWLTLTLHPPRVQVVIDKSTKGNGE